MVKILVTLASLCTIGFGVWHFFVPAQWDWYSYISPQASELAVAIRAINVFFSLSLVLFGAVNLLFVYFAPEKFNLIVVLGTSFILWTVRCLFQIIFPQGSANPWLQYGMLTAFVLIWGCFAVALLIVIFAEPLRV